MRFLINETFLLLGGGGMVGRQITQEIARELNPHHIIICSLTQAEVDETIRSFKQDFPDVSITGIAGDVFLRHEWNPSSGHAPISREQLMESEEHREALYEDLFGSLQDAYERSELVWLIRHYAPNVIIDSINTATAFSYQDVYSASNLAKKDLDALESTFNIKPAHAEGEIAEETEQDSESKRRWRLADSLIASVGRDFEKALVSQSVPQLVRHVLLLSMAMKEADTRLYMKIGTTGTGGMGLNIPYTHSEDKPSATLMEKTAIAFAHTGLMFLMARTLGGPAVKEFKPAAMIGYADIGFRPISVRAKGKVGVPGKKFQLYASRTEPLEATGSLRLRPAKDQGECYESLGNLNMVLVNTGENGFFTKGEFQAITYMRQMEFITPEEIARQAVLEIKGGNTGYDVIAAIDGATMSPTYRAGYLRHLAIEELEKMEAEKKVPSVALGELGPPELGKLLWEAHLLDTVYGNKDGEVRGNDLDKILARSHDEIAEEIFARVQSDEQLRNTIVSVGLPILTPQGRSLIRGPYIRIPERPNEEMADYGPDEMETWAAKGWVDLRPQNMERWQQRFAKMKHETERIRERGSAAFTREAYLSNKIKIGAVVGWVFNNEEHFGYRIK